MTIIHVGEKAPDFEGHGWFVDGQTGAIHAVRLGITEDGPRSTLTINAHATCLAHWPLKDIRTLKGQTGQGLALGDPANAETTDRTTKRRHMALQLVSDPLARLYVDDAGTLQRLLPRIPDRTLRQPTPNKGRIARWAVGALASVALIIFVLVPLMADQLAEFLPPEGEQALGDATYGHIREALSDDFLPVTVCETPDGLAALDAMTTRLTDHAELPYPLRVTVLDHEMVNAFALPGGRVILFQGLIEAADTPEEVAAVLAHEIGHVAARDPSRGALRSAGSIGILGLLFGDFAGGTVVLYLANQLINAQYSQSAEADADAYAHALMGRAGVSAGGLATFFEKLHADGGEETGVLAHFMAHPALGDRIAAAEKASENAPTETTPVLTADQWLAFRDICS